MASGKPTASSYSAAAKTTNGLSPLQWGDKCFLCGNTIGEADPIGFYQGKNSMMRSHRGCLDKMDMLGGTPKDFHKFMASKGQAPRHDKPVHQDIVQEHAQVEAGAWSGPRAIRFDDFAHLQSFIVGRGAIPSHVRVYIGDYVVQAGGGN
ncbi:hypothetical protein SEA_SCOOBYDOOBYDOO_215 [Mycobacterium phage ScoobyDoobyDoo]|nr:hypothetical protein SEA_SCOOBYDOOBYDOO_215 [Mycobacterium phage ScoobyDoobyDoo]